MIGLVTDVVPVSTPPGLHLLNDSGEQRGGYDRNGNISIIILMVPDAIKTQFFTPPNAICVGEK